MNRLTRPGPHTTLHIEGGVLCTACIRLCEGGATGWGQEPLAQVELERELAMRIGSAETIDAIDDEHWIECGQYQMGLSRRYTQRTLDELRGRLLEVLRPTADRLLEKEPAAEPSINAVRRALEQPVQANLDRFPGALGLPRLTD